MTSAARLFVRGWMFALIVVPEAAWAQSADPSKPVYIAVGLQAGTASDIAVRAVADRLRTGLGQLRAIAWSGERRFGIYPDLPRIQEAGVGGFRYEPWTAVYAPASTPKEVVSRLNADVRKASNQPELVKRWANEGLEPRDYTAEYIVSALQTETRNTRK